MLPLGCLVYIYSFKIENAMNCKLIKLFNILMKLEGLSIKHEAALSF